MSSDQHNKITEETIRCMQMYVNKTIEQAMSESVKWNCSKTTQKMAVIQTIEEWRSLAVGEMVYEASYSRL